MNSTASLTGSHLRTYHTIFQHPVSHNLGWHDVHALFRQLGRVDVEPNGNLKVTRNAQTLVLPPPRTKDVAATDELMALRHFLERSEATVPAVDGKESHWLLVIDHQVARIFHPDVSGGLPQEIRPPTPVDDFRQAPNSKGFPRGQEKPNPNSFFEPVARALQAAGHILIFGTGTGTSSAMDQFTAWSKTHHPELARRFIGTLVVDVHHLTDGQLLAKAREFYASHRGALG